MQIFVGSLIPFPLDCMFIVFIRQAWTCFGLICSFYAGCLDSRFAIFKAGCLSFKLAVLQVWIGLLKANLRYSFYRFFWWGFSRLCCCVCWKQAYAVCLLEAGLVTCCPPVYKQFCRCEWVRQVMQSNMFSVFVSLLLVFGGRFEPFVKLACFYKQFCRLCKLVWFAVLLLKAG